VGMSEATKNIFDDIKGSALDDLELEQKFLASIIQHPELILDAEKIIFPHYFLYYANLVIYTAIIKRTVEDNSVNNKIVYTYDNIYYRMSEDFRSKKFSMSIGKLGFSTPHEYYNYLSTLSISKEAFSEYCNLVMNKGIKRQLLKKGCEFQETLLTNTKQQITELSDSYIKECTDIVLQSQLNKPFEQISGIFNHYIDNVAILNKQNKNIGLSSGFEPLDNALNFLQRGNLYIVLARPKIGKSTFLLKMADNVARQNIPVLYIDTEMNTEEVIPRLASLYSGVDNYWIINGTFSNYPEEEQKVYDAKASIATTPLYHIYRPGISIIDLITTIKMWLLRVVGFHYDTTTKKNVLNDCFVVFDYIKISKRSQFIKDYQILGEMTTALKDLAGEMGFPMFTAVQNNRTSIKEMGGKVVNAEMGVANSDEILQFTNYLIFLDKIRDQHTSIVKGIEQGIYHNYSKYDDDRLTMELNDIFSLSDQIEQDKRINALFGNRLLSIVAGRQNAIHENNQYFVLDMDFAHSDVNFNGELSIIPLGKKRSR